MKFFESNNSVSLVSPRWEAWRRVVFAYRRPADVPMMHETCEPAPQMITLHSCLQGPRSSLSYLKEFLKLTVRSHLHYRASQQWIAFWNSTPLLADLARSTPRVLQKIYRPYLTNRLRCRERLDLLLGHYTFVSKKGLGPIVLQASRASVPLCEFPGKSGLLYQIHLAAVGTLDREGELVLHLIGEDGLLFSVACTFFAQNGPPSIAIGCLQGPRAPNSREHIRKATRDLFGLRPKNLLVHLVRQIGHHFGCDDMILVGNKNLVGTRHIRKGKVFADYDATWEELGAVRRPDGDFSLSCAKVPQNFDAIASKKRSEAKKRFALIELTSQLTCAGLRSPLAGK